MPTIVNKFVNSVQLKTFPNALHKSATVLSSNNTKKLFKDLRNANYFNNGFVQLQGTSYYTKNSHSVLVNHGKTFQFFSRTYKQKSRTFKDFPEQEKKSRTFQDFSRMWQPWFNILYFASLSLGQVMPKNNSPKAISACLEQTLISNPAQGEY